ncbi:hypothetical protein FACS189487_07660 [Campylobacterota bacterium]|nr:hypothetical protein FACS189487_07660 [Campylobacterota bacterium]
MKTTFKTVLLIALISLFAGCGGGGGGGSDDKGGGGVVSLASINAYFPAFDEEGLTIAVIGSTKQYRSVPTSKINSFVNNLVTNHPFVPSGSNIYKLEIVNVLALATIGSGIINLSMSTHGAPPVKPTDGLFDNIYDYTDADVVPAWYASIVKAYTTSPSSKFDSYADLLKSSGKMDSCEKTGVSWDCRKLGGDLEYFWSTDNTAGTTASWVVFKSFSK